MKCSCVNIEIGSYGNQVRLTAPDHLTEPLNKIGYTIYDGTIWVDACLSEEIKFLWSLGIRTTGCCCGHNTGDPYIGVINEDIPRMKELGYKVHHNPCRPGDEDSFIPKLLLSLTSPLVGEPTTKIQKPRKE